ncbi:hypothetical protein T492DRAFT_912634 [Pavlovales sp. CCMP2436]|nr:hypothetical protein T492DRAFT_912634 [Pavlovales sp. CCMP2436]
MVEARGSAGAAGSAGATGLVAAVGSEGAAGLLRAEDYGCGVCHELLFEPVSLVCGHVFCRGCLERTLRHTGNCALCREPLLLQPHATLSLRLCLPLFDLLRAAFPREMEVRHAEMARQASEDPLPEAEQLDLFVLDSTLPGQQLFLNIYEPRYLALFRRLLARGDRPEAERFFGMVGVGALYGVACVLAETQRTFDGRLLVHAKAIRRFKICRRWQEPTEARGAPGIMRGVVEYVKDPPLCHADGSTARASALAVEVASAAQEWIALVRAGGWERSDGQMDALLSVEEGIGPQPESPAELSWWAAALVNPLPPLGVANEVRPAALAAENVEARLVLVLAALEESSASLQLPPPALALTRVLFRPVDMLGRGAAALARTWLGLGRQWWIARSARRGLGAVGVVATLTVGGQFFSRAVDACSAWITAGQATPAGVAAARAVLRL